MRSMATDMPAWLKKAQGDMQSRMHSPKYQPTSRQSMQPAVGSASTARAVRSQAVATSHNTFRPDIYRVSEGYLN